MDGENFESFESKLMQNPHTSKHHTTNFISFTAPFPFSIPFSLALISTGVNSTLFDVTLIGNENDFYCQGNRAGISEVFNSSLHKFILIYSLIKLARD
jgi:hypothetical protein